MTTTARRVPRDLIALCWAAVEPFLAASCAQTDGDTTVPELLDLVIEGRGDLWLIEREGELVGAGVTQVAPQSDGRMAFWILAIGAHDRPDWPAVNQAFEHHARLRDVKIMRGIGRPGWGRVVPGYRRTTVMFVKDLD